MKNLFSWLLRVGVLIVLAAIAWVIYVNFQQQSGQPAVEHATPEQQPADDVPQTSPSEDQTATTETPATAEEQASQPAVIAEPATPSVTVQLPTTEPAAEADTPPVVTAETEQPSTPTPSATPEPSAPGSAATETTPPTKAETAQPAATTGSTAETDAKPATEQPASLQEARLAAWKGQWDKAESVYRELQQGNPEDYNIHGELGNLYYMQRKGKEAAEAYYQAATLLAAQGYQRDAMRLMQVIQRLDPGLGSKLQQELFPVNGGGAAAPSNPASTPSNSP
jgi:tetratricopeptide (TPR) repeat protein